MASPQIEKGHIDIANEIADMFCFYRLSGQEWQIIWVVLRKTWGWLSDPKNKTSPKKKMDRISLSQFETLSGIDRRKCHEILKKLIFKNVIKKTVTQKGDKIDISYGFQKDFDKWVLSPKKVTVPQKGDGVSPKKGMGVSPKKVNTKETITKETITKETITKEMAVIENEFKIFYKAYPNHKSPQDALAKWISLAKKNKLPPLDKILTAIEQQVLWRANADGDFRPEWKHPATWLNKGCWDDEVQIKPKINTDIFD